ncbi:MAG: hypothetical protein GTO45_29065 [Candidatus Aminicenantes bacterium]|nr:hypothetical protein [Candidatus Aminicenantes bacterium]NIM82843.1 hypothetical protein [Candidatus Aminicenantes bacterium]NIN22219.1 hypothetical protein [Candidatus Aminicenantes bacterium]NIN45987.1 hypothetical protein [Candidatus Aminicenantes bacterium]NIN88823.1 hypothetical protein [Candidatus Aminicenantes bacterium]
MKAKIIFILLTIYFLSFGFAQQNQSPGEVVDKCVKALGGEKGIENFSNFEAKGEAHITFGTRKITGKVKEIKKGKRYWAQMELSFGSSEFKAVRAFDGKTAWMDRMGTIVNQPSLNLQSDADHTPALLLEKEANFKITGEKEIEGKKAIRLEVEFKGKKTTFFIDQTDYTILEILFKDLYFGQQQTKETIEKRIRYMDYKKKGDAMFPFGIVYYQKGKKNMEVKFSEVTFNPTVSSDIFTRPDQELDLRYREEMYH